MSNEAPFPWFRAAVFLALCGVMIAGPVHNQVLYRRYHPYLKPWRMYFGFGTDLCEVTYVQRSRDGQERPLDRYELLGHADWYRAPEPLRKLPDGPTIGRIGKKLCTALPARHPDVRAHARCASIHGWQTAMEGEQNLCELGPRQIEGLRPKAGRRR